VDWTNLASSVVIGAVAAFLAARLALGRFYKERWWEKKLAAYTTVIEAIHHMKRSIGESLDATMERREIPEAKKSKLDSRHSAGSEELERAIDIGELLFSPDAVAVLQKLRKAVGEAVNEDSYFNYLEKSWVALDANLADFKAAALSDLRLKRFRLPWTN
jgi:hypothetical protein